MRRNRMHLEEMNSFMNVLSGKNFKAGKDNKDKQKNQAKAIHKRKSKEAKWVHVVPGLTLLLAAGMLVAPIVVLAGCSSAAQSKPPQPPSVSVAPVECKQFGDTDEFTGRLEAVNNVEVRPRVSGYLQSVN